MEHGRCDGRRCSAGSTRGASCRWRTCARSCRTGASARCARCSPRATRCSAPPRKTGRRWHGRAALAQALGVDTAWHLRSHAELAAIVAANPFPNAARAHSNHLLVHFHAEAVPAACLAALRHDGPERLRAVGRELYVDYPDDVGHSKLPAAMARAKFPAGATARNWNTVVKLRDATA